MSADDLETSFVLVEGDWPCARAARLVHNLDAEWLVLRLLVGDGERFRVFDRWDALAWLEQDGAASVGEASAEQPSEPATVVSRRGRIVGLRFEDEGGYAVRGGWTGATRGEESVGAGIGPPGGPVARPQPAGAGAAADPGSVSRAVKVSAPSQLPVDQRAWVVVQLVADMAAPGTVPVATTIGESIGIVAQASGEIEIEGTTDGELTVTAAGAPALRFRIHARAVGAGEVTVYVFQGQHGAGSLTVRVDVVAQPQPQPATDEPVTVRIGPPLYQAPDLQLIVLESQGGYTMRLSALDPRDGLNLTPFGPFTLQPDPRTFFDDFYKDIEGILVADATPAQKVQRLARAGNYLGRQLLPDAARAHLWRLRGRIRSVHVQSEEPWIPWELIRLLGDDGSGSLVESGFLCEDFEVTRWVPGLAYKADLSLTNMTVVTPGDSGLAAASAERQAILGLQGPGRQVTEIEAEEVALRSALALGRYDGFHFTGHGTATAASADAAEIRLEDGSRLRPQDLTGVAENLGRANPIVFLNACQIGRAGLGLTGPGGWPRGFLAAGAGAFVGPFWKVIDSSAASFAQAFYAGLLAGATVGKAARDARGQIKVASDPTWLAYAVYGHAAARVV